VFTGDVAFHGKKNEYELAVEKFFEPLLRETGVPKDRLFIVPGNHDVDRDGLDKVTEDGMRALLGKRDETNHFLSGDQDRRHFFRKFDNYGDFINTYFERFLAYSHNEYFYTRVLGFGGTKLAILGLNSAWMSGCSKDTDGEVQDRNNLLVGELQLEKALDSVQEADLRVAILHHPLDWLNEDDRYEIKKRLEAKCEVILHGHLHMPRLEMVASTAGQATYIPVGAIYEDREFLNGYNFVQLDLASGNGTVFLRRYNDTGPSGAVWMKDIQSTGDELDGRIEFHLRQQRRKIRTPVGDELDENIEFHLGQQISGTHAAAAKKILLVEDELSWQRALQVVLIPPSFDLHIARTYEEAIGKLHEDSFYDLILINLCLENDRDGLGVAILDAFQDGRVQGEAPCIVLTGWGRGTRGLYDRYDMVCDVFFKGPSPRGSSFDKSEFLRKVNEVLGI
jgi:predicted phosphodiesterase/CheY-like chemotaxis protein